METHVIFSYISDLYLNNYRQYTSQNLNPKSKISTPTKTSHLRAPIIFRSTKSISIAKMTAEQSLNRNYMKELSSQVLFRDEDMNNMDYKSHIDFIIALKGYINNLPIFIGKETQETTIYYGHVFFMKNHYERFQYDKMLEIAKIKNATF